MAAPAADDQHRERTSAGRTRIATSPASVDAQRVLVGARLAVAVQERGERRAPISQAIGENLNDRTLQSDGFVERQGVCRTFWVETGHEQRLVGVDVAETCHHPLIEQDRLEASRSPGEPGRERLRCERGVERFRAESSVETDDVLRQDVEDATEFALIREPEVLAVIESSSQMLKAKRRGVARRQLKRAGHAKVDQERGAVVQFEAEVFAAAHDVDDGSPDGPRPRRLRPERANDAGEIADAEIRDRPTADAIDEGSTNSFDFGEFWHTGVLLVRRTGARLDAGWYHAKVRRPRL